jgi:hypothetical protein
LHQCDTLAASRAEAAMDEEMMERVRRLADGLPDLTYEPWFGTMALKVGRKALAHPCRYPGTLAVYCPPEDKRILSEADPQVYYDTDHFQNWPSILVRMDRMSLKTCSAGAFVVTGFFIIFNSQWD